MRRATCALLLAGLGLAAGGRAVAGEPPAAATDRPAAATAPPAAAPTPAAAAPAAGGAAPEDAGQQAAIDEGRQLYGRRCFVCHLTEGGRGPNLRATRLSDEAFLATVLDGRKVTQMPAFRGLLTREEVRKILAFLKARSS